MGKQERAAIIALAGILISALYYGWALYVHDTWALFTTAPKAAWHILRNTLVLGIALEILGYYVLRRSSDAEVLEDERDIAIGRIGLRNGFHAFSVGLMILAWQVYMPVQLHGIMPDASPTLPPAIEPSLGAIAHLLLALLAVGHIVKYTTVIWLYRRDRT